MSLKILKFWIQFTKLIFIKTIKLRRIAFHFFFVAQNAFPFEAVLERQLFRNVAEHEERLLIWLRYENTNLHTSMARFFPKADAWEYEAIPYVALSERKKNRGLNNHKKGFSYE